MISRKLTRSIAMRAAAVAVAIGACVIVQAGASTNAVGAVSAAPPAQTGPNQRAEGQVPQNWHPGTGTIITGDAADRAKTAALTKYPGGTDPLEPCIAKVYVALSNSRSSASIGATRSETSDRRSK